MPDNSVCEVVDVCSNIHGNRRLKCGRAPSYQISSTSFSVISNLCKSSFHSFAATCLPSSLLVKSDALIIFGQFVIPPIIIIFKPAVDNLLSNYTITSMLSMALFAHRRRMHQTTSANLGRPGTKYEFEHLTNVALIPCQVGID